MSEMGVVQAAAPRLPGATLAHLAVAGVLVLVGAVGELWALLGFPGQDPAALHDNAYLLSETRLAARVGAGVCVLGLGWAVVLRLRASLAAAGWLGALALVGGLTLTAAARAWTLFGPMAGRSYVAYDDIPSWVRFAMPASLAALAGAIGLLVLAAVWSGIARLAAKR